MNVHNEVMDPERTGLGEPHPVQMISPSGERLSPNGYELDTLEMTDLMTMYRSMVLLRRFDQEATALQRQGELGPRPRHPGAENTTTTLAAAINRGLRKALEDDPRVVLFGEDIGALGGVFRITDGLQKDFGDQRVIDAPLVEAGIVVTSVRKTGRLVIVHEAPTSFGVGAEIAARVGEKCFYDLEAPVIRVGGFHTPYPASRSEHHDLPDVDRILDGIDRALEYGGGDHEYSPVQAPGRRRGPHGSGHPDLENRRR